MLAGIGGSYLAMPSASDRSSSSGNCESGRPSRRSTYAGSMVTPSEYSPRRRTRLTRFCSGPDR